MEGFVSVQVVADPTDMEVISLDSEKGEDTGGTNNEDLCE